MHSTQPYKNRVSVRRVEVIGDIAYVPLTQGQRAVIDAADAELIGQWNWGYSPAHNTHGGYAKRSMKTEIGFVKIPMHRVILPPKPGFVIDHIDRDKLNNRRDNLRYATHAENNANCDRRSKTGCGFKEPGGTPDRYIYYRKSPRKYLVKIHIGHFDSKEEATKARDAALELLRK